MNEMPGFSQPVAEGSNSLGQPLRMVEQQNLSHLLNLPC